jgi:hypothetical protein
MEDSSLRKIVRYFDEKFRMKWIMYLMYLSVAVVALIGAMIFPVIGIIFTLITWEGWVVSLLGFSLGIDFIKTSKFGKKAPIFDKLFKK